MTTVAGRSSAPAGATRGARRRAIIIGVLVLLPLAFAALAWHLLRERPVPKLLDLFPAGGTAICADVAAGVLDDPLARLIDAAIRYHTTEGSWLGVPADVRRFSRSLPVLMRTLPWRLSLWEGEAGDWLAAACAGGMGKVLEYFVGTREVRGATDPGNGACFAVVGGVFVAGAREERVREFIALLGAAPREYIAANGACEITLRGLHSAAARMLLAVPSGASAPRAPEANDRELQLMGTLRPLASDEWSLTLDLPPAVEVDPGEWGLPGLRDFLLREGIGVTLRTPAAASPGQDRTSASWRLDGIAAYLAELAEGLDAWSRGAR